jgi:hypothetical protein
MKNERWKRIILECIKRVNACGGRCRSFVSYLAGEFIILPLSPEHLTSKN